MYHKKFNLADHAYLEVLMSNLKETTHKLLINSIISVLFTNVRIYFLHFKSTVIMIDAGTNDKSIKTDQKSYLCVYLNYRFHSMLVVLQENKLIIAKRRIFK